MNLKKAWRLLRVRRPGGQDDSQAEMREATIEVRDNPDAAKELAAQQRFDFAMSRAVQDVPIPAGLLESILAARQPRVEIRPRLEAQPWWRHAVPISWAAALLAIAATIGLWARHSGDSKPDGRRALVESTWGSSPHLEFVSSDLGEIKKWLGQRQAYSEFTLPEGLRELTLRGCRTVGWRGGRAAVICFGDGMRHLHLVVTGIEEGFDIPEAGVPDFEKTGPVTLVSWRQGGSTYLLTGMKSLSFVRKFRKSGQWTTAG